MNRFTAIGLGLTALAEQKTVLILTAENQTQDVMSTLGGVSLVGKGIVESVDRSNGAGEVRFAGGGRLVVRGIRTFHPMQVDLVFVDDDATWILRTAVMEHVAEDIHDRVSACVRGVAGAEVVYA